MTQKHPHYEYMDGLKAELEAYERGERGYPSRVAFQDFGGFEKAQKTARRLAAERGHSLTTWKDVRRPNPIPGLAFGSVIECAACGATALVGAYKPAVFLEGDTIWEKCPGPTEEATNE